MATSPAFELHEDRAFPRDEVLCRTRATGPDGRITPVVVVNISAGGLMMRCDAHYPIGERMQVSLPVIGVVSAEIRWSLGGRLGCRLDTMIPTARYHELLAAMVGRPAGI